jgi:uncharacterized membrane protein
MIPVQHIHPLIVHFPIVFFLSLVAIDIIATFRGNSVTSRTALGHLSTGLAILSAGAAATAFFFGGMALDVAESAGFHSDIAEMHEALGEKTAIAFCIWAAIRCALWVRNQKLVTPLAAAIPLMEIAGAALVVATAYYGGQLVYDLGVNVAGAAHGSVVISQ